MKTCKRCGAQKIEWITSWDCPNGCDSPKASNNVRFSADVEPAVYTHDLGYTLLILGTHPGIRDNAPVIWALHDLNRWTVGSCPNNTQLREILGAWSFQNTFRAGWLYRNPTKTADLRVELSRMYDLGIRTDNTGGVTLY